MQITIRDDIHFSRGRQSAIESHLGEIGRINLGENSYMLEKGTHSVDIDLQKLLSFTKNHSVSIEISDGEISLL